MWFYSFHSSCEFLVTNEEIFLVAGFTFTSSVLCGFKKFDKKIFSFGYFKVEKNILLVSISLLVTMTPCFHMAVTRMWISFDVNESLRDGVLMDLRQGHFHF